MNEPSRAPAGQRERIIRELVDGSGKYTTDKHAFEAARPFVSVRELKTGILVAWSGTNADFLEAVDEFVRDFT